MYLQNPHPKLVLPYFANPSWSFVGFSCERCKQFGRKHPFQQLAHDVTPNDTAMLACADAGFLFHAPDNVIAEFPQFPSLSSFSELLEHLSQALDL